MRWSELVGLRGGDVDVDARKVRVTSQLVRLQSGKWLRKEPKTPASIRSIGAGLVGLFPARSAWPMGAGRAIAIDHLECRPGKARTFACAETYTFTEYDDIVVHMKPITEHLGADVAIDAVGPEADGNFRQHVTSTKLKLQGGSRVARNWAIDSVQRAAPSR